MVYRVKITRAHKVTNAANNIKSSLPGEWYSLYVY